MTTQPNLKLQVRCSVLVDAICRRLEVALLPVERKYLMSVVLDFPGLWMTATDGELEAAIAVADLDVEQGDLMHAWMNQYPEMLQGVVQLNLILRAVGNPRTRGALVQQVYMRVGQVVYMLDAGEAGRRFASPNSRIMLHRTSGGMMGTSADVRVAAENMLKNERLVTEILARHCKRSPAEVARHRARPLDDAGGSARVRHHRRCRRVAPAQEAGARSARRNAPEAAEPNCQRHDLAGV